jgi:hypothetical protein
MRYFINEKLDKPYKNKWQEALENRDHNVNSCPAGSAVPDKVKGFSE